MNNPATDLLNAMIASVDFAGISKSLTTLYSGLGGLAALGMVAGIAIAALHRRP